MTLARMAMEINTKNALIVAVAFTGLTGVSSFSAWGEIYRWDNGQLITGTVGITPAPGANLSSMNMEYANLNTTALQSANLAAADLYLASLTSANLTSANLSRAYMSWAILTYTNFTSTNLTSAYLDWTNLTSANLTLANLASANLYGATLASATFTGATVAGANFFGATGFVATQLYATASYQNRDLHGIYLPSNMNLSGGLFSSQNLTSAYLYSANLTAANLSTATLTSSNLTFANLTAASLSATALRSANLMSANLSSATLTSADFTLADLRGASGLAPVATTILRGTILPDGTVPPFSLHPGEALHVRAGTPVTLTGAITFTGAAVIAVDSAVTVTSSAVLNMFNGSTLQLNGTLVMPVQASAAARHANPLVVSGLGIGSTGTGAILMPPTGTLDLKNNDVVLRSGSYTPDQVRQLLLAGLTGLGLQSSNKAANEGLAYLPGSTYIALHGNTFDGVTINPGDVVVKYTYLGDTDGSGKIDANDFAQLEASWLKVKSGAPNSGFSWLQGDCNYDGKVDAADFTILDAAYIHQIDGTLANDPNLAGNAALLGMSVSSYSALITTQFGAAVPEPGSLTLLGLGLGTFFGFRGRRP